MKNLIISITLANFLLYPFFTGAQTPTPSIGFDTGVNAISGSTGLGIADTGLAVGTAPKGLAGFLLDIITLALSFGAVIALGALVWGGITYVISLGNDQDIQKAKKIILWAIIGLLVMGLSFAIIAAVSGVFRP